MTPTYKDFEKKKLGSLESFDSFFAGLPSKDERRCTELYEQYVLKFLASALKESAQNAIEACRVEKLGRDNDLYLPEGEDGWNAALTEIDQRASNYLNH